VKNAIPLIAGAAALFFLMGKKGEDKPETKNTGDGAPPPEGFGEDETDAEPADPEVKETKKEPGQVEPKVARIDFEKLKALMSPPVPATAHCQPVSQWDSTWTQKEQQMFGALNAIRQQGYNCATGNLPPAPPLKQRGELTCAARLHSKDMAENNYFAHTNLQGKEPWDRMAEAGYPYFNASENIYAGSQDASHALQKFLQSTMGHCEAIFSHDMEDVGIGYFFHNGMGYWTVNFGAVD
jgi:uncharacterized protein YkwD